MHLQTHLVSDPDQRTVGEISNIQVRQQGIDVIRFANFHRTDRIEVNQRVTGCCNSWLIDQSNKTTPRVMTPACISANPLEISSSV